jgi:hypothetical protein
MIHGESEGNEITMIYDDGYAKICKKKKSVELAQSV